MEQKHNPSEPLQDPTLVGEVLGEFFKTSDEARTEAIQQRRTQVRDKLKQHHSQSLRDGLEARSEGELEESDDSIQTHREELWKLDAENKGVDTNE